MTPEQKEAVRGGWTPEKPNKVGLYEIRCGETNGEPERVAVIRRDRRLYVHEEYLGVTDLTYYHEGLTYLEWRFIA